MARPEAFVEGIRAVRPAERAMTHSDVGAVRATPGRSALLFVTDRCPVGCAHCSVDSRADSPTIADWALFGEIVDWLCDEPGLDVVGISGGEPFVERRGLELASRRLEAAGRRQVVYTSGVWASRAQPPRWIADVLARCSCVYLSTDAFHARQVDDARYVRAAHAIADAGAWIVVQVVGIGGMVEQAERLLRTAFGERFEDFAELVVTPALTHGRGAGVFAPAAARTPGHAFGPCALAVSPVVRYDGLITGCCNESIVMDRGPGRLRRRARSGEEVAAAVEELRGDPLLHAIGATGLGALTAHPRFADLAAERFATNCELCWKMLARSPERAEPDPLVAAIGGLLGQGAR
jgi:pyruvate-formate lyase-activating enzyme